MNNRNVIASIGISPAKYCYKQDDLLEFMHNEYKDNQTKRKLNILFKQSGIQERYSTIPDFNYHLEEKVLLKQGKVPNIQERLDIFKNHALPLATQAIKNAFENIENTFNIKQITHIITVSCTGIYAPGLGADIIEYYKLPITTFQTGINFMGCNAAFPALRIADLIVSKDKDAIVLIVFVELCTLHFQSKNDNDNLLANTIFSDGAAAIIVTNPKKLDYHNFNLLQIGNFSSITLSQGKHLMAWNIKPVNFEMVLSGEVPDFIAENFDKVLDSELNISMNKDLLWAVHPGGKKILDLIKKRIPHTEGTLKYSYHVLEQFGNMSSVTILFVLYKILLEGYSKHSIICIGFGPGMSIDTLFLDFLGPKKIGANPYSMPDQIRNNVVHK